MNPWSFFVIKTLAIALPCAWLACVDLFRAARPCQTAKFHSPIIIVWPVVKYWRQYHFPLALRWTLFVVCRPSGFCDVYPVVVPSILFQAKMIVRAEWIRKHTCAPIYMHVRVWHTPLDNQVRESSSWWNSGTEKSEAKTCQNGTTWSWRMARQGFSSGWLVHGLSLREGWGDMSQIGLAHPVHATNLHRNSWFFDV